MLSTQDRYAIDRLMGPSLKYRLGKNLDQQVGCYRGHYDVAQSFEAGAIGIHEFKDKDNDPILVPDGNILFASFLNGMELFTSATNSANIVISLQSVGDIFPLTNVTSIPLGLVPIGSVLPITQDSVLTIDIQGEDLITGSMTLFLIFFQL